MENDSDYIAYEILDNNPMNEQSVEFLYSAAEVWIEQVEKRLQYPALQSLDEKYQKIKVWFDPEFDKRIQNISSVDSNED